MLAAGQRSHWHRVDAAEIWHWYAGAPLLLSIKTAEKLATYILGSDLFAGEEPQAIVPAHAWQSAKRRGNGRSSAAQLRRGSNSANSRWPRRIGVPKAGAIMQPQSLDDIVHVIQVALTPVFLLSGVGVASRSLRDEAWPRGGQGRCLVGRFGLRFAAEREQILVRLGYLRRRSHASMPLSSSVPSPASSTSGAALMLFVGTLRNGTGSTLMFLAFGVALVLTIGALTAFLIEMLMASRGIRAIVAAEKAQQEGPEPDPERR